MFNLVQAWVIRQLTLGEFSSRRAVVIRATWMAAKIAVFAYLLNVVGHLVLVAFGLLPYPLLPALVVATMVPKGVFIGRPPAKGAPPGAVWQLTQSATRAR